MAEVDGNPIPTSRRWSVTASVNSSNLSTQESTQTYSLRLQYLDPELQLDKVHNGTFASYKRARLSAGIKPGTINKELAVVRHRAGTCSTDIQRVRKDIKLRHEPTV